MAYETLDMIADTYIPLVAAVCTLYLIQAAIAKRWPLVERQTVLVLAGIGVVYGLRLLDSALNLWPTLGLDYSTHTAVATVLVMFLCTLSVRLTPLWAGSLMLYLVLMLYQKYHTLEDILTTILAVDVLYWPVTRWYRRRTIKPALAMGE